MRFPLLSQLSFLMVVLSVIVCVVAFVPTFLGGLNGIEVATTHLRESIDSNIKNTFTNYMALPVRFNHIAAEQIHMNTVGVNRNITEFRIWCFAMLKRYPEITYFAYGQQDNGAYVGCETGKNSTSGENLWFWYGTTNADDSLNLTARRTWVVDENNQWRPKKLTATRVGYDPRKRSWWIVNRGPEYWTDPYLYSDGSKTAYSACIKVPVDLKDPNGTLLGIFLADYVISVVNPELGVRSGGQGSGVGVGAGVVDSAVKFRVVSSYLSEIEVGKTGWSVAVDHKDGTVVGVSWPESLLIFETKNNVTAPRSKRLEELQAVSSKRKEVLSGSLGTSASLARAPFGRWSQEGHWISKFAVSHSSGIQWDIIVAIPETDFLAEIRDLQRTNLLIVAGVVVLLLLLAVLATQLGIVKPLALLDANMGHLAALDVDLVSKAPPSGIKEIQTMQTSFDTLQTSLNAFFKYVPVQVVKTLNSTGSLAVLGMHSSRVTISFTDIKGFTPMCTRVTPDVLAIIITAFFEIQTRIVHAYRGCVDKYIGDCQMVLWGAPLPLKRSNLRAICAALAMDRATMLECLLKLFSQCTDSLVIRTGIHVGNCLIGNMGTTTRMNYTAIGDPVNTAARLEAVNKDFGTRILISQDVATAPEDGMNDLVLRQLTNVRVIGREEPLPVYEVIGLRGSTEERARADPVVQVDGCAPLSLRSMTKTVISSMPDLSDIKTAEILLRARTMCRIVSPVEEQWAAEFSAAVERYVAKRFEEALPLLQAAARKAPAADAKLLNEMIRDCQGPRVGFIEGIHK